MHHFCPIFFQHLLALRRFLLELFEFFVKFVKLLGFDPHFVLVDALPLGLVVFNLSAQLVYVLNQVITFCPWDHNLRGCLCVLDYNFLLPRIFVLDL